MQARLAGKPLTKGEADASSLRILLRNLMFAAAANDNRPSKSAQATMRVALAEISRRCCDPKAIHATEALEPADIEDMIATY